jgi:hypothetical protein
VAKAHPPDPDDRLKALEVDVQSLKDRLTAVGQATGDFRLGGTTAGSALLASALPGQAILFPFGFVRLFASFPAPQTYKIDGTCGRSQAIMPIPGPGNYILTVSVPKESDCAVEINDSANLTSVVVNPGNARGIPYNSTLAPSLIASCRGTGGDCVAELTLTQVS